MDEESQKLNARQEETQPYVPTPVSGRIWAWMGVVYVLLILCLMTYWIATTRLISGITGVMLFPLLAALSAQGVNNALRCSRGERRGNVFALALTAGGMGALALGSLVWGIGQTLTFFGG